MNVVFLPNVMEYFEELKLILLQKEYFGFKESAYKYVDELIDEIQTTLPICVRRPAPKYFDKYGKGMYYANFRKNRQTQWYVFFKIYQINNELFYQVRHIANNHTIAQYFS
jgi:hypothetical protein